MLHLSAVAETAGGLRSSAAISLGKHSSVYTASTLNRTAHTSDAAVRQSVSASELSASRRTVREREGRTRKRRSRTSDVPATAAASIRRWTAIICCVYNATGSAIAVYDHRTLERFYNRLILHAESLIVNSWLSTELLSVRVIRTIAITFFVSIY